LPQSIFYKDEKLLRKEKKKFSKHENLTICLRDKNSLKVANQYFPCSTNLLVPDMAFCMDMTKWERYVKPASDTILFLSREDSEKKQNQSYDIVPACAEVHDWLTMKDTPFSIKLFYKVYGFLRRIDGLFSTHFSNSFSDTIYKNVFRKRFIKEGISFLSSYSQIYTTRLHGAILSILLQKSFVWFDNSYGKSSSFYDTWLFDVENIKFIRE
jgi:pyruvyl transferase EpsO